MLKIRMMFVAGKLLDVGFFGFWVTYNWLPWSLVHSKSLLAVLFL